MKNATPFLALCAAFAYVAPFSTSNAQPPSIPAVEWVLPALPSAKPQTPEQTESGRIRGRHLPTPELLQPTLDPALARYQPTTTKLKGSLTGAASDVLPVLVQMWFQRFKKYHPDVTLEIVPPYAGSLGARELIQEKTDFVFVSR